MLQINSQGDPIVEILRLAYRRGRAIQREQEEKRKAASPQPIEPDDSKTIIEAKDEKAKVSE